MRNVLPLLIRIGGACCAALVVLVGMGTLLFLLWRAWPVLDMSLFFADVPPWEAIRGLQPVWDGIWPACIGTLMLMGLTLLLALFPGIGCGIYLAEYATPQTQRIASWLLDILSGVPSIVMGLFGFTLILFLRHTLWPAANTGLLLAASCLALLVLPTLVITTREALHALPHSLRLTTVVLGFSREQTVIRILLPAASRGIGAGVVLALGRAAEDTAVILLTGAVASASLLPELGDKFQALPFTLYYTAAEYQSLDELNRGFGAALILLLLSVVLLAVAQGINRRYRLSHTGEENSARL